MGFGGLVYTDSMSMDAVAKMVPPDEGAVRAVLAGADQVLHSPDPIAAFNGIKAALASGRLSAAQIDASVERVLRAKASVGLHLQRAIDLDAVPSNVGGRAHEAVGAGGVPRDRSRSSRTIAESGAAERRRATRRSCICRCSTTRRAGRSRRRAGRSSPS